VSELALSANAISRDIKKGLQAGFYPYPAKSIMVMADELMEKLKATLEFAAQEAVQCKAGPDARYG